MKSGRVKVSVGEGYSRWAREYDDYPNPLIMIEEPIMRGLLETDVSASSRVLDVACGTGRHTHWLASRGATVTGVDANKEMLEVAKTASPSRAEANATAITWLEGDATKLPVKDESFDVVMNALLLEHVPDVAPVLKEMHRALVPGGAMVVSVYHPYFLLKGVATHFASTADGVEYEMPTFVHLTSAYLKTLTALNMKLTHFEEPIVDDALIARRPNMDKHRGLPLAIIFRALRT